MKKNITSLIEKLQENANGTLKGGFAGIKGGFALIELTTNAITNCTNSGSCTGSNANTCVNSGDCTKSTNTFGGAAGCSNTGACYH